MAGADWNLDDTTRDAVHKRIGLGAGLAELLGDLADWVHPQSDDFLVEVVNGDEDASKITKLKVTSCEIGVDTSEEGIAYVDVTDENPGAGQALVEVFADQPRSVLVAQGSAANGAQVTLVPETGYTFAATLTLGTIAANMELAWHICPPPQQRVSKTFDGTQIDDAQNEAAHRTRLANIRGFLQNAAREAASMPGEVMRTTVRRLLVSRSSENALIDPGLRRQPNGGGQIEETPTGILEDWRLAQEANTGGSTTMKAGAATATPSLAYGQGWTGITSGGPTLGARSFPCRITYVCIKTLDSTPPTFRALLDADDKRRQPNDGKDSRQLPFELTIGKSWKDPSAGVEALTIDYSPSVTNSSGTPLSTTPADYVRVAGLTADLSDGGKLYAVYRSSDTKLLFFKTSAGRDAQDEAELVTYVTLAVGATATVFVTEDIGNGLIVTGKTGATLANGNKATLDFVPPTPTQPASRFTLTIAHSVDPSLWVRAVRDGCIGGAPGTPDRTAGGWEPHTGSSPNLKDGWIRAGIPFIHSKTFRRRV